ncbi:MAG: glucose 1-dehydrogenase [Candidatus Rokubacteria bacterium]|nr:glucose 1-dehydrogenase [Candidatus Rokubacteria bacterium]
MLHLRRAGQYRGGRRGQKRWRDRAGGTSENGRSVNWAFVFPTLRLAGKVALISGGARGMGAAEARLFTREGARVVLGDILEDEGRQVAAEVERAGGTAVFVRLDVTREADWQRAVATAEQRFGALHVLVNNAGVSAAGRIEDVEVAEWDRVMDINATGVFLGTKAAIPALRRAGGGSIINISSQLGLVGSEHSSPQYQASKGAARLLTKSTAIRHAAEGIRVNSVHPGPIATPLNEARRKDPDVYGKMVSRVPMGRYGDAEEVAYGVLYLASDESSYVTGSELVIDGGWTAQEGGEPAPVTRFRDDLHDGGRPVGPAPGSRLAVIPRTETRPPSDPGASRAPAGSRSRNRCRQKRCRLAGRFFPMRVTEPCSHHAVATLQAPPLPVARAPASDGRPLDRAMGPG